MEVKNLLEAIGSVRIIQKWASNNPSSLGKNVALLQDLVAEASESAAGREGVKVFVGGNSFGCRVAVEMLKTQGTSLASNVVSDRVLCFGYPLYGPTPPKATTDRVAPLLQLPADLRVTFVSGERDEFLDRDYVTGPRGIAGLEGVAEQMDAQTEVVAVTGGRHNCLQVSKSTRDRAVTVVRNAIISHCAL